jgi:hypothetical protein
MIGVGVRKYFALEMVKMTEGITMTKERPSTENIKRVNALVSEVWIKRVDDWRRHQEDIPSVSESIRRLVDIAIDSQDTKKYRR